MVAFINSQPSHLRLTHGIRNLKRGDSAKVIHKAVHHQIQLHLCDLRDVVVLFLDALFQFRNRMPDIAGLSLPQLLFHGPYEGRVLFQKMSVFFGNAAADFLQVFLNAVQNAGQHFAVFDLAVELAEHLIRIVDRSDWLIGPGVTHASPRVSSIRNHHAEFKSSESCASLFF